jgi:2-methylisocitrate lyase-like PEP mutase family enzyme
VSAADGPFGALHRRGAPLVLPNAWDVTSALLLARAGHPAIGTTSLGVTAAAGLPDGAGEGRELTIALAERLVPRLTVPLTVDLEGGYSDEPAEVGRLVAALADAGVAGVNLEDGQPGGRLRSPAHHAEVVAAAVEAAPAVFVNARTDTYWLAASAPGAAPPGTAPAPPAPPPGAAPAPPGPPPRTAPAAGRPPASDPAGTGAPGGSPAGTGAPGGSPAGAGAPAGSPSGAGDRLDETIGRLDAYRRAGAHGAFVPFVTDLALVAAIADAIPLPLNVLWQPGSELGALAAAGAARISTGSALYRQALAAAVAAVPRLDATPDHGPQAPAPTAVPYAEVQDLLA